MGRKGGLASIFSSSSSSKHSKPSAGSSASAPSPPWPWPSCATKPQTASFRGHADGGGDDRPCTTSAAGRFEEAAAAPCGGGGGGMRLRPRPWRGAAPGDEMYKTVNSVYFDAADSRRFFFDDDDGGDDDAADDLLDLEVGSFCTTTASEEWSEAVIRSLGRTSTDRFFFDAGPAPVPAAASNSVLAASPSPSPSPGRALAPPPRVEAPMSLLQAALSPSAAAAMTLSDDPADSGSNDGVSEAETELPPPASALVEESVAVALDSEDPFRDFRASMHEMVAAHGLRDWAALQEMLLWYLRINGKHNHALIVGAFVDLLVGLATSTSSSSSAASPSATTTATTTMTATTACCCCCSSSTSSSSTSSSAASGGDGSSTSAAAAAMQTRMSNAAVE